MKIKLCQAMGTNLKNPRLSLMQSSNLKMKLILNRQKSLHPKCLYQTIWMILYLLVNASSLFNKLQECSQSAPKMLIKSMTLIISWQPEIDKFQGLLLMLLDQSINLYTQFRSIMNMLSRMKGKILKMSLCKRKYSY